MRVYSYAISQPNSADHHELVDLWHRAWSSCGFEPVMLTERDASRHPDWKKILIFAGRQASNQPFGAHLSVARWLRFLAYSRIFGGALCTDVHVLPQRNSLDPDQFRQRVNTKNALVPLSDDLDSSAFWLGVRGYDYFWSQWANIAILDKTLQGLVVPGQCLPEREAFRATCQRYGFAPAPLVQLFGEQLSPNVPLVRFDPDRVPFGGSTAECARKALQL